MKKLIIWDWNGTLLNDTDACIQSVNRMLEKRDMETIDRETYRDVFGFPVIDYYKVVGFDLERESFDVLADEYVNHYLENASKSELQEGAVEVLDRFRISGYTQIILSAMQIKSLKGQVGDHDLIPHFDAIIGLDNKLAHSKVTSAQEYFQKTENPGEMIMIGDTYHDYEVAVALGCRCILVRNGHQNLDRFDFSSETVLIESLAELQL